MGYMALIRNLRNFTEAGVGDAVASAVAGRIANPEAVAKSRQLPFRFYSAYLADPSDRYKFALGKALDLSLKNVPKFDGRTLVLIDTSGSMGNTIAGGRSSVQAWQQAALFGLALANGQNSADVYGFDTNVKPFALRKGEATLQSLTRFAPLVTGGATRTRAAVRSTYSGHDRVVVLSDQQAHSDWNGGYYSDAPARGGVFVDVPQSVPCYTFDVVGYGTAHSESNGNRRLVAGLTDSAFKMVQVLEATGRGVWPWDAKSA